jgi:quercetin dioxygenase-like cupin family protein
VTEAVIHRFEQSEWHIPASPGNDPAEVEAAGKLGVRRKYLSQGDGGFYTQIVQIPPDFESPAHSHSHAEVFMVLEGNCTVNGEQLSQYDSAVIPAGADYGFRSGPEGLRFLVVRGGAATFSNAND